MTTAEMSDEGSQAANSLQAACDNFFGVDVQEIARRSYSEGSRVEPFQPGITTGRILLNLLYLGKHKPEISQEADAFARLVGHEQISRLEKRYALNWELLDPEVRNLMESSRRHSNESEDLLKWAADLVVHTTLGVEPHHLLAAIAISPSKASDWLMKDNPEIWNEVATSIFEYSSLKELREVGKTNPLNRKTETKQKRGGATLPSDGNDPKSPFNVTSPEGVLLNWAAAEPWLRKGWDRLLESHEWSLTILASLESLQRIAFDLIKGSAILGGDDEMIEISAVPQRLTPAALFYGIVLEGVRSMDSDGESGDAPGELARALAREIGRTESQLVEKVEQSLETPDDDFPENKAVTTPALEAALKRAVGIANTLSDGIVSTRHIIAAIAVPPDDKGTPPHIEIEEEELDFERLLEILQDYTKTSERVKNVDKDGGAGWIEYWMHLRDWMEDRNKKVQSPASTLSPLKGHTARGRDSSHSRNAADHELALDIDPLSDSIKTLFETAPDENDFVFALYGPWGRGKTTLMNHVRAKLKPTLDPGLTRKERERQNCRGYAFVDFSAWKFPSRPEVWVHLYETIAERASHVDDLNGSGTCRSLRQKIRIGFRTGVLRAGWFPIFLSLFLLGVSQLPGVDSIGWLKALFGFGSLATLVTTFGKATNLGRSITKRYVALPDHSERLGMQSVIGRDLDNLLRIWISTCGGNEVARLTEVDTEVSPTSVDFRWGNAGWRCFWSAILVLPAFVLLTIGVSLWSTDHSAAAIKASSNVAVLPLNPGDLRFNEELPEWRGKAVEGNAQQLSIPEKSLVTRVLKNSENLFILSLFMIGVWGFAFLVYPRPQTRSKLLLIIDDLDRCRPDQMLSVIESLRIFLDNKEMSRRMQIAMLVDDRLLGHALIRRAEEDGIQLHSKESAETDSRIEYGQVAFNYIREQREKLFIAELALAEVSKDDLVKMADLLLPRDDEGNIETEAQEKSASIQGRNQPRDSGSRVEATGGQTVNPPDDPPGESRTFSGRDPDLRGGRNEVENRFESDEAPFLKKAIEGAADYHPTPRQIRTLLSRYQLARLLLDNQRIPFEVEDLIRGVLHALRLSEDNAENSDVRKVARIVACPPSTYSDELVWESVPQRKE